MQTTLGCHEQVLVMQTTLGCHEQVLVMQTTKTKVCSRPLDIRRGQHLYRECWSRCSRVCHLTHLFVWSEESLNCHIEVDLFRSYMTNCSQHRDQCQAFEEPYHIRKLCSLSECEEVGVWSFSIQGSDSVNLCCWLWVDSELNCRVWDWLVSRCQRSSARLSLYKSESTHKAAWECIRCKRLRWCRSAWLDKRKPPTFREAEVQVDRWLHSVRLFVRVWLWIRLCHSRNHCCKLKWSISESDLLL